MKAIKVIDLETGSTHELEELIYEENNKRIAVMYSKEYGYTRNFVDNVEIVTENLREKFYWFLTGVLLTVAVCLIITL